VNERVNLWFFLVEELIFQIILIRVHEFPRALGP
jgi:hypothetical protein